MTSLPRLPHSQSHLLKQRLEWKNSAPTPIDPGRPGPVKKKLADSRCSWKLPGSWSAFSSIENGALSLARVIHRLSSCKIVIRHLKITKYHSVASSQSTHLSIAMVSCFCLSSYCCCYDAVHSRELHPAAPSFNKHDPMPLQTRNISTETTHTDP